MVRKRDRKERDKSCFVFLQPGRCLTPFRVLSGNWVLGLSTTLPPHTSRRTVSIPCAKHTALFHFTSFSFHFIEPPSPFVFLPASHSLLAHSRDNKSTIFKDFLCSHTNFTEPPNAPES